MNIDVLPRFGAAALFALEAPFLENRSHRSAGEKRLLVIVIANAIEVGDLPADQFLRRKTVSTHTLVTAGDDSIQVGGEDRVLQLVQNAWLKSVKTVLVRPGGAITSSAPSYGLLRFLGWRSLR